MDASFIGKAIDDMVKSLVTVFIVSVLAAALIVGGCTNAMWYLNRPTPESLQREHDRQTAIESLTPEHRKALGL